MNSKAYCSSFNQLIALNSFGKLVLNPKATSVIRSLPAPISIVTMIGPKSSGKSFLLSQLANEYYSTTHNSEEL
jgi:polynucleotide 5'-kinase involved in rRNA processing